MLTIQELIEYLQALPVKTGNVYVADGGEFPSEENHREGGITELELATLFQYSGGDIVLLYRN